MYQPCAVRRGSQSTACAPLSLHPRGGLSVRWLSSSKLHRRQTAGILRPQTGALPSAHPGIRPDSQLWPLCELSPPSMDFLFRALMGQSEGVFPF